MKRLFFGCGYILLTTVVLLFLPLVNALAQGYGNEWIDFSKDYFKLSVAEDGIFKLTFSDLTSVGFPVGTVDPRGIQLYFQGKEQSILIEGEGDGRFDTEDVLFFYGQRNDGKNDTRLYTLPDGTKAIQPHSYYSLYSDTSAYFLTWNTGGRGKRMTVAPSSGGAGLDTEKSHQAENLLVLTENFAGGVTYSRYINLSQYDTGEGWCGRPVQENRTQDYILTGIDHGLPSEGLPELEVQLLGRSDVSHVAELFVGPNAGSLRSLGPTTGFFRGYTTHRSTHTLEWSDISADGNLVFRMRPLGLAGGNDFLSVSYLKLNYPQAFDMSSKNVFSLHLKENTRNDSRLEINGVELDTKIIDITDSDTPISLPYELSGTTAQLTVPDTNVPRQLLLTGDALSPTISKADFEPIVPSGYDYIIISHRSLMRPAGEHADIVQAYADYREAERGGSYTPLIVDIDQLYDQFNYGLKSPLAIMDFMRFMVNLGEPKFLFIIGKGLMVNTSGRFSTGSELYRNSPELFGFQDLVPTAGFPGSDILFTAGLEGHTGPAVPTGRITATNPNEVLYYLNKIQEMEQMPYDMLWRKRLLHISGGQNEQEQSRFRTYVNRFKSIAEKEYLGGQVATISKKTDKSVELINVSDEINRGTNLVTFFGHTASQLTDVDIGFVSDPTNGYDNKGKYPMFLINGCNAGQIFNWGRQWGEDWILTPDKGALAFMAHTYFGFESPLNNYSNIFYSNSYGSDSLIHQPIGLIQKFVSEKYSTTTTASPLHVTQVQQMILMGDPATPLFGAAKSDYEINDVNIFAQSVDGEPITAQTDAFDLGMIVRNFGRIEEDSIEVNVKIIYEDSSFEDLDDTFPAVYFQDTLYFTIDNTDRSLVGNLRYEISIDLLDQIEELSEENNVATFEQFVPSNGTLNLFPENFGIVGQRPLNLITQAASPFATGRGIIMQLDTTDTFDSPFKQEAVVSTRHLASWSVELLPDVPANDSIVYFWRTRFEEVLPGESREWVGHSFVYIKESPVGWSQSDVRQYKKNQFGGLSLNVEEKKLSFEGSEIEVDISTYGGAHPSKRNGDVTFFISGTPYVYSFRPCKSSAITCVALDKTTLKPYVVLPFLFRNNRTCGRRPQVINSFNNTQIANEGLLSEFIDQVPEGDVVIMFSIGNLDYTSWSSDLIAQMESVGASATTLTALEKGEPYILIGRKGALPGESIERVAENPPFNQQELSFSTMVKGSGTEGIMQSGQIGPARDWSRFVNEVDGEGLTEKDDYGFTVFGINIEGEETELITDTKEKEIDLNFVSAETYPYLRLEYHVADEVRLTPPQLHRWQVLYTSVPESVLAQSTDMETTENKIVEEGEVAKAMFAFTNISTALYDVDSLSVEYTLSNRDLFSSRKQELLIKAPLPGDTTLFTVPINTIGSIGSNDLRVFANPIQEPERRYDNNVIDLNEYLRIVGDRANPILDVAFDGAYIRNGGIVSPSPMISITLRDENRTRPKKDTLGFDILLKLPCGECQFDKINFSDERLSWLTADEDSDFMITLKLKDLQNGIHTLMVQAEDASGNSSGDEPYAIDFEVVNENSISEFTPYPNPFTKTTSFVFTMTGDDLPDNIRIQIMNLKGEQVREISQEEVGPLFAGEHITKFVWDGNDRLGRPLAGGIYFYKAIVQRKDQPKILSSEDEFKGYGKVILIR